MSSGGFGRFIVKQSPLPNFFAEAERNGSHVRIRRHFVKPCSTRIVSIERAHMMVGLDFGGYQVLSNNCEHFVTWAKTGHRSSKQSNMVRGGVVLGAIGTGALFGPVGMLIGGIASVLSIAAVDEFSRDNSSRRNHRARSARRASESGHRGSNAAAAAEARVPLVDTR